MTLGGTCPHPSANQQRRRRLWLTPSWTGGGACPCVFAGWLCVCSSCIELRRRHSCCGKLLLLRAPSLLRPRQSAALALAAILSDAWFLVSYNASTATFQSNQTNWQSTNRQMSNQLPQHGKSIRNLVVRSWVVGTDVGRRRSTTPASLTRTTVRLQQSPAATKGTTRRHHS